MNSIFGYLALIGGIYCLYGYYRLKVKQEITSSLINTKDVNLKKCKDYQSYCKALELPLIILSLVLCICGAVDLYYAYTGQAEMLSMLMGAVVIIALLYYSSSIKKVNSEFF